MSPETVFEKLSLLPPAHWRETWELSAPGWKPDRLFFLEPDFIRESCAALKLEPEVTDAFLEVLPAFRENASLARLAWHCHYLFFTHDHEPEFQAWPQLPMELGRATDMFYALLMLSGLPHVQAIYRQRQIPAGIAHDTLADLRLWMGKHQKKTGHWGLSNPGWICQHFTGRIYRLGRLQFLFDSFRQDFCAFRNIHDRRVILLTVPGIHFRQDGQYDGVNGIHDPQAFTSTLDLRVQPIRGNPVLPTGRVLPQTIALSWTDWVQILAPGDPTLSLHIPAGGKMDFTQCGESLNAAAAFFPQNFPERPVKGWTCDSWLLDPNFETYLPPDSNIVRFLQEMYLHPVRGRNAGVVGSVFDTPAINPLTAPRDTALRRAVLEHLRNGGLWCGGGSVLFPEDLAWGSQPYRRQQPVVQTS